MTAPTSAPVASVAAASSFPASGFAARRYAVICCVAIAPRQMTAPSGLLLPAVAISPTGRACCKALLALFSSSVTPRNGRGRRVLVTSAISSKLLCPSFLVRSRPVVRHLRADTLTFGHGKRLAVNTATRSRMVVRL